MLKLKQMFAAVVLFFAGATAMTAQMEMPSIPVDEAVRIGKLDNGLTYYIRHNEWPEHRAEFFIAQRVGSIQENDDQRGLAHFLEHMCFNGTTHFKGNDLIRWCESIGVQFGRDLNAYNSIDQTVYNISNVPSERTGVIDSCLLILYDWADGLLLEPEEIDKERGVIHEEWRLRTSAASRMFERNLPALYPGSKYGHRYPIGLMEIIDNFKPKVLRDYYEKWYRPDNQAIIVVGDLDVDYVEGKIKEMFGKIVMPQNPAPVELEPVPDNDEPIFIVDKDKEMRVNEVEVMVKHDPVPDEVKKSLEYLLFDFMKGAAISMLNDRLAECAEKAETPFVQASASYGQYVFAKTKDAFDLSITPKENQTEAAMKAALVEARRAAEFGFTATEYLRFKQNYESQLDKNYSNKDKRYNVSFCNKYKNHFLDNEPIPSIEFSYQTMKQVAPVIPLDAINELMKELFPANDSNMVVVNFNQEKEGAVYPTAETLKKALAEARAAQIEAYVDNVKDEPLMTTLPQKGSILKEEAGQKFDTKELTLSNGVKVILKHTDLKADQVILRGEGFGGSSLYGEKDYINLQLFDDVVEASGLGNFSHTELEKALAGKIASASLSMSTDREYISGSSTPKDVETMLQLIYLYFTNINKDQQSYDKLMQTMELQLKNKSTVPEQAFSDSLRVTINNHDLRTKPLELEDLQKVSYDRILEMAKERTANANGWTFTIVGNYDEATIRPLIEQYLAALPSQKDIVKGKDIDNPFKGKVICDFKRKMETPKAMSVVLNYSYDIPYSLENLIRADMAGQILSMIYLKKIREDASAAYTVQAMSMMNRDDYRTNVTVLAVCPMKPEMSDVAIKILREELDNLAKTCDEDMLTKVKEYMLKNIDDEAKTNSYWVSQLRNLREFGVDTHTDYKATVQKQTPADICNFMKQVLASGNHAEVIMMPEE